MSQFEVTRSDLEEAWAIADTVHRVSYARRHELLNHSGRRTELEQMTGLSLNATHACNALDQALKRSKLQTADIMAQFDSGKIYAAVSVSVRWQRLELVSGAEAPGWLTAVVH